MIATVPEISTAPDPSLSEWDNNVLSLIVDEALIRFSFDGLKRRLGMHPETLSRVLYRFEDQGMIEKTPNGYKVTRKGRQMLGTQQLKTGEPGVLVLQTLLPPDVPVKDVVSDLAGKWFGTLRWLGYARLAGSITLKWVTEDGGIQVDASFSEGALNVEAKMLSEKNLNIALRASYQLIEHITKIYSRPDRIQHVGYFYYSSLSPRVLWM